MGDGWQAMIKDLAGLVKAITFLLVAIVAFRFGNAFVNWYSRDLTPHEIAIRNQRLLMAQEIQGWLLWFFIAAMILLLVGFARWLWWRTDREELYRRDENRHAQRMSGPARPNPVAQVINGAVRSSSEVKPKSAKEIAQIRQIEARTRDIEAATQLKEERVARRQEDRVVAEETEPVRVIPRFETFEDAVSFAQSQNVTDPLFGQDIATGVCYRWTLTGAVNWRIVGATGSGKSMLLQNVLAQLIRFGHEVVILDRSDFADFYLFEGRAQLIDTTDPQVLLSALSLLWAKHEERLRYIREHSTGNQAKFDNLPVGDGMKRLVIVLDEYTGQMVAADDTCGKEVRNYLVRLTGQVRKSGGHVVIADQYPVYDVLPSPMRANLNNYVSGDFPEDSRTPIKASGLGPYEFKIHTGRSRGIMKGWEAVDLEEWLSRIPLRNSTNFIDMTDIEGQIERVRTVQETVEVDEGLTPVQRDAIAWVSQYWNDEQWSMSVNDMRKASKFGKTTITDARRYVRLNGVRE